MSLPLPTSLTPSKVASFKDCALAFRFSAIDCLPEPPSPWTLKGTLVHRALERLFWLHEPGSRTIEVALSHLDAAWSEAATSPELVQLDLDKEATASLREDTASLVRRYFELEDPDAVNAIGVELQLEVEIGGLTLRGIIDRLDLDEDGELVVTDYKTGSVPGQAYEQSRLGGVHFYAFLCEELLGRRPARVQLLYLKQPIAIVATPSEQSVRGLRQRSGAIWSAIERACRTEDFRPKPSGLCEHCAFRTWCPAFGGDPARARADLGLEEPVPA